MLWEENTLNWNWNPVVCIWYECGLVSWRPGKQRQNEVLLYYMFCFHKRQRTLSVLAWRPNPLNSHADTHTNGIRKLSFGMWVSQVWVLYRSQWMGSTDSDPSDLWGTMKGPSSMRFYCKRLVFDGMQWTKSHPPSRMQPVLAWLVNHLTVVWKRNCICVLIFFVLC